MSEEVKLSTDPSSTYTLWRLRHVAEATPSAMRELLSSREWKTQTGELAIQVVKLQLQIYDQNLKAAAQISGSANRVPSPMEAAARKLAESLDDDPDAVDVITDITNPFIAHEFCSLPNIPYSVLCRVRTHISSIEPVRKRVRREQTTKPKIHIERDIDTWILQNEDWLRARKIRNPDTPWNIGLISLDQSRSVFGPSCHDQGGYLKITRPEVDGFKCLDAYRQPHIYIQSNIDHFTSSFDRLTNRQLKGLNWSNVFIAGGLVLGALLCVDAEDAVNTPKQWESSDVDIYVYGLTPSQANDKIRHLYDIFKRNLPSSAPILVVRNSKTISFISKYPIRRFQIILKMCQSPAEVLLNFDLDICAMGYDGEQLYMLPRAARALETGYNVFTMDMVQGHYLGTRRASQEQRVFKYARKGYGIRILPSYLDALKTVDIEELPPRNWYSHQPKHLNIEKQVEKARDFFDRVFRTYLTWSRGGRNLQRTYVYRKTFTGTSKVIRTMEQKSCNVPIFTHALLDTVAQLLNEPLARSCLTGFELFYRHVGLFEAEAAGKCVIEPSVWASTTYEEVYYSSTYSDLPNYVWDETFRIKTFKKQLDRFNEDQTERTIRGWEISGGEIKEVGKEPLVRRIVHGTTVEEVFEQDLQMMVWMPEDFVVFAREMVAQVAKKCDMEPQNNFINEFWRLPNVKKKHSDRVLYEVKIDTMVMWQQVDRRLDEIFELIWSFMFSNDRMQMEEDARFCLLELQISRRALRSKAENEFLDFALWVARDPGPIAGEDYGGMGRGFWGHALYDAEDPYEGEYVDEDEDDEYDHFLESRMYDRWVGYMLGGGLMGFGGFRMGWDGNDDDDDEYGDDVHGEGY